MKESFDAVCFGEILWDVLPTGSQPGGAPMNVAYHLQKLGMHTALVSRVGKDKQGEALKELLDKNNLTTSFVQIDADHPTGLVNAVVQANNEVSYDIVYPVAWDFISWEEVLTILVKQAPFFVYGTLAARSEAARQTLWRLRERAQIKVMDVNLRTPYFSQELVEDLVNGADIVKLNEHELVLMTSWYSNLKKEEDQVRALQDHFLIPTVIVTKGGHGAMVCREGQVLSHPGYTVKVADTIGSGDAFLAAFLYKVWKGVDTEETLQFANGLGALIASKQGACPLYGLEELKPILEQHSVRG